MITSYVLYQKMETGWKRIGEYSTYEKVENYMNALLAAERKRLGMWKYKPQVEIGQHTILVKSANKEWRILPCREG